MDEMNIERNENAAIKSDIKDIVSDDSVETKSVPVASGESFTITIESGESVTDVKVNECAADNKAEITQPEPKGFVINVATDDVVVPQAKENADVLQQSPPAVTKTDDKTDIATPVNTPETTPIKVQPLSNEAVTTHTASLWKYKPIPTDEPESHEEYKCLNVSYSRSQVIGASVRGKKHKHEGTNRDDWFECVDFEDWVIVAVSDGAGSKKYSRIGAKISCEAATSFIKEELAKQKESYNKFSISLAKPFEDPEFGAACGYLADLLQKSVLHAIAKVEEGFEARKDNPDYIKCVGRDLKVNDFAGTFLISIIVPLTINEKQETLILSCQIGDGIIAAIDGSAPFANASKLLGEPDSGSFSGETDFLVSPAMKDTNNLMSRTRITRGTSKTVLLMSDGVADDYFPNETEIKRLYLDLLANGILDNVEVDMTVNKKTISNIKKLPDATAYPWVNDPDITVAIQYVKKMQEAMKCSLEDLWDKKEIFSYAAMDTQGFEEAETKADKLRIWLDNYVERGSFDDRTLVIVNV